MHKNAGYRITGIVFSLMFFISGCGSSSDHRPSYSSSSSASASGTSQTAQAFAKNWQLAWDAASKGDLSTALFYVNKMTQPELTPQFLFLTGKGYLDGFIRKPDGTKQSYPKDPQKGFQGVYFSALAEDPVGQAFLGTLYYAGEVTSKNLLKAYYWLSMALKNPKKLSSPVKPRAWDLMKELRELIRQGLSPNQLQQANDYLNDPGTRLIP